MDTQPDAIGKVIDELQRAYLEYMSALKAALDFGDASIQPLISALNHKHASPIAKALGLMMHSSATTEAFPLLLDWLVAQTPLYPDVLEALVRARDKPAPMVFARIQRDAENGDDEAVRNLFDLACRFPDELLPQVVEIAITLLDVDNPNVRDAAVEAIARIGLPHGRIAIEKLQSLSRLDKCENVRESASYALGRLVVEARS